MEKRFTDHRKSVSSLMVMQSLSKKLIMTMDNFMRKKYSDTFGDDYKDFMEKALVGQNLIPQQSVETLGHQQVSVSFRLNLSNHVVTKKANAPKMQQPTQAQKSQFTNHDSPYIFRIFRRVRVNRMLTAAMLSPVISAISL